MFRTTRTFRWLPAILCASLVASVAGAQTSGQRTGTAEAAAPLPKVEPKSAALTESMAILDASGDMLLVTGEVRTGTAKGFFARILDSKTGQARLNLRQFTDRILAGAFSGDGSRTFIANGNKVTALDAHTGAQIGEMTFPNPVRCIAALRTGAEVAVCTGSETHTWVVTGTTSTKVTTHSGNVNAARITPSDRYLFTTGDDGTIQRYDLQSRKLAGEIKAAGPFNTLDIAPGGTRAAAGGSNKLILVWEPDAPTLTESFRIQDQEPVTGLALTRDGSQVAVQTPSRLRLLNTMTRQQIAEFLETQRTNGRVVFTGQGTLVAAIDDQAQTDPAKAHMLQTWSMPAR